MDHDRWVHWFPPSALAPQTQIRNLIRGIMGLHSTFTDEFWLWRGQGNGAYGLTSGMHTRVDCTPGLASDEKNAEWATNQLIAIARENQLDAMEGFNLPDLALLAHLQHHGAATPLLDVSVDPLVALWMAVNPSGVDVKVDDDKDGLVFAIRRPPKFESLDEALPPRTRWVAPLDSRPYTMILDDLNKAHGDPACLWYRAPDVSERLRIQRGSFLIGQLRDGDDRTTLPLNVWDEEGSDWLSRRVNGLGRPGKPVKARTDVAAFVVRAQLKEDLRVWLEDRAGLDIGTVYPTPWHRPFLDEFCRAYGRDTPVAF